MKWPWVFLGVILPAMALGQLNDWDTDQDAMPNGWEYHRGLDIHDPKDAWADPDSDGICNLYEYFLGSDPQDARQPLIIEWHGHTPLSAAIRQAGRGVVLRLPGGHYDLNYQHVSLSESPRILIQGGWDEHFSHQDPCRFPTVLDGQQAGSIFDYFLLEGTSAAVILDGLTLQNGRNGAIKFSGYLPKQQLLLANCRLFENTAHRASAVIDFADGSSSLISDLILVNTLVADNAATGLLSTQQANRPNLKILHSALAYNRPAPNNDPLHPSGYGLRVAADSDSTFHLQVTNSIFWRNAEQDIRWEVQPDQKTAFDVRYNIYGFLQHPNIIEIFSAPSNRSIDPRLHRQNDGTFFLTSDSPAVGAGLDIGFSKELPPDIGTAHCSQLPTRTRSSAGIFFKLGSVFPNPAIDQIQVSGYLKRGGSYKMVVYSMDGSIAQEFPIGWQSAGSHMFRVPIAGLTRGPYLLSLKSGERTVLLTTFIRQ